jgi:hypothetical protein
VAVARAAAEEVAVAVTSCRNSDKAKAAVVETMVEAEVAAPWVGEQTAVAVMVMEAAAGAVIRQHNSVLVQAVTEWVSRADMGGTADTDRIVSTLCSPDMAFTEGLVARMAVLGTAWAAEEVRIWARLADMVAEDTEDGSDVADAD